MKNNGNFLDKFNSFSVSKHKKIWFSLPSLFIVAAILVIVIIGARSGSYTNGVNIGIDFEGGTMLTVTLGDQAIDDYDAQVNRIKTEIEKHGVTVSYVQKQEAADRNKSSINFRYKNISRDDAAIANLNEEIIASIDALYPDIANEETNFITYESIGATAASDLLSKAGIAIAVSTLLILIYIIFRFTFVSGVAAIIALLHDVIIMFALTVICRIQINTSFVAAVITIIAYSINNTIIIFDRCREYVKPLKGQKNIDYDTIGDLSVRENMRRSVFTTATTMVTIIFLAILGSDTIREFCVPIILGLIAGFYSSVFLATPMWASFSRSYDSFKAKRLKGEISYEHLAEAEEDMTVPKRVESDVDDDSEGFAPKRAGGQKPKNKPVYKYSKKNTTFKKK